METVIDEVLKRTLGLRDDFWCSVWYTGLRTLYMNPKQCWDIMVRAPMEVPGSGEHGYSGICIEEVCPVCREDWMCALEVAG